MKLPQEYIDRITSITDSINISVNSKESHLPDKISNLKTSIALLELEATKLIKYKNKK